MRYLGEIVSLSLLLLVSCSDLRTGDLVFVRPGTDPLASSMSGTISSATGEFVHVAIVEVEDGDVWVILAFLAAVSVTGDARSDCTGRPQGRSLRSM